MRDALSKVLDHDSGREGEDAGIERILAAAFFRKRPLQAGTSAQVVLLAAHRSKAAAREVT